MVSRRELLRGAFGTAVGTAAGLGAVLPTAADAAEPRRHVIGYSYLGRAIVAYRLGRADARSRYLVLGSMHGDEPVGHRLAVHRLVREQAPPGVQLWVVPTMNPDGLAAHTRTNARGVDLNRNFPSSDWTLQGAGTRYWSGPAPASERETRVMVRFLSDLVPHTIVSIHQPLACVDFSGGDRSATRWLADRLHLPAKTLGASGGNLTAWFNDAFPRQTALTLELAAHVGADRVSEVADVLVRHAARRRG